MLNFWKRRSYYKKVFETEEGKVVLAEIIRYSKLMETSFVPNDPQATAFNEGMRRVALRISSILHMSDADVKKLTDKYTTEVFDSKGVL